MPASPKAAAVPLVDLKAHVAAVRQEIDAAVARVFDSGVFVLGPEVEAFEKAFAAYCGVRHAIGVNSGTSALHLALLAAGVGPQDEVITVPFTFVATIAAIEYTGARPVLVDIDPVSYTMDVDQIERHITPRTKVILTVHLYGQPADMDAILEIARCHGLMVIEDASQAHGARYRGRRTGGLGDLGCFSFYPTKNLGACGEGGAVVTNDDQCAGKLRMLRDWGQDGKYNHILRGYNYRMDALQGALLGVKLRYLDRWTEARRQLARRYTRQLDGLPIGLPKELPEREHAYHIYAVRVRQRDRVRERLAAGGIATAIHYPAPAHLIGPYRDLGYAAGAFPASEQAAAEQLSLPLYPELTEVQQDQVIAALRSAVS